MQTQDNTIVFHGTQGFATINYANSLWTVTLSHRTTYKGTSQTEAYTFYKAAKEMVR